MDWFTFSLACVDRGVWVMAAADAGWGGGPARSRCHDGVHADGLAGHRVDPSPAMTHWVVKYHRRLGKMKILNT